MQGDTKCPGCGSAVDDAVRESGQYEGRFWVDEETGRPRNYKAEWTRLADYCSGHCREQHIADTYGDDDSPWIDEHGVQHTGSKSFFLSCPPWQRPCFPDRPCP